MSDEYNFRCTKCGNTEYIVAENDREKVLICNKCAEGQVIEKKESSPHQNIPKCPICQSTNLSKICTTKKVAKIVAFGIFGMGDNGKTWKCNNCGSKF